MTEKDISNGIGPYKEEPVERRERVRTLGNVRLRHQTTNDIILVPAPSDDPNDPLNWSQAYKYYMASLICLAMMMCNFLAAGPSVAILQTATDFFPGAANVNTSIQQVSYFLTTTSLMQGVGNFFWVPLTNKFGRRPVYIASYTLYLACAIWLIFETDYSAFLAARIIMGLGAGAAETIAPVSIADVFFLHERGFVMSLYTGFLSVGVAFGMIIDGLILINHPWRVIYQVAAVLVAAVLLLAFFTFPETAYVRTLAPEPAAAYESATRHSSPDMLEIETLVHPIPPQSYLQSLKIFHRVLTEESLVKMFFRPLGLICLPPVLWAALVQSVTVGFLSAVASNVANAFSAAYGFAPWQTGLCFVAAVLGSLLGIPAGGQLGDATADYLTRRNGGVRDPEMRLPAMIICLVATPLGLMLYGVGVAKRLRWICPTVGLGLVNFSVTQGTNVCLVYVIDAYRPIAGEITLTVMGFKSIFGFLLSFYTNQWVAESGYLAAFGAMAGIAAAVLVLWVPLFVWGKAVRHATWRWPVVSYIRWTEDREVGE